MIKVTPVELVGADERGSNHVWSSDRTGEMILCYRKAGSSSGQHYHEGKSAHKNPEILYLLTGEASIHWCPLGGNSIQTIRAIAPARIEVPILVWHQLVADTDCCFIEMNSMDDVRKDSVRIWRDEFEKMINK